MAGADTLRPIVVAERSRVPPVQRGKFGILGTAAWLCLAGMGSSPPLLHTASASVVHADDAACRLHQRNPLYVGFPSGFSLGTFEESALASRNIVREMKHWACDASTSTAVAVPSLQMAFAGSAPIRLDRVQLDDSVLTHAYVVVSSGAQEHERQHWRVDLRRHPEAGWAVTGTGVADANDLVEP